MKLFISHASEDVELADLLVDELVILGLGIGRPDIFYSGRPETGVPGSANWFEYVRSQLREAEVTILIVTSTFLSKDFCLIETGAAWMAGSILPLGFGGARGVLSAVHILDGGDIESLDQFGSQLAGSLNVQMNISGWNRQRTRFLNKLSDLDLGGVESRTPGTSASSFTRELLDVRELIVNARPTEQFDMEPIDELRSRIDRATAGAPLALRKPLLEDLLDPVADRLLQANRMLTTEGENSDGPSTELVEIMRLHYRETVAAFDVGLAKLAPSDQLDGPRAS